MIALIVAMAQNRVIGKDNRMPWRLPADLAYFKRATMGHPVVMGRKTYESIGKPLPGRRNIILTRDPDFRAEGCEIYHSIGEVLALAQADEDQELFIIGGDSVYSAFFPYADRLYLTLLEQYFAGDAFFPEIDPRKWRLVSRTRGETNKKNPYEYSFLIYEKATPAHGSGEK
jgi:dihydrofolate reductase